MSKPWQTVKSVVFFCMVSSITLFFYSKLALQKLLAKFKLLRCTTDEAHMIASQWGQTVFRLTPGWRVRIIGKENLPGYVDGQGFRERLPFIMVANHESASDIFAIYLLQLQFRWLAKAEMFKLPGIGMSMKWSGYVSVDRKDRNSRRTALERSAKILKESTPMLFFPEGTRSTAGQPQKFKAGAFILAKQLKLPIVPVILHGTSHLLKKGSLCPNRAMITIKVLPAEFSSEEEPEEAFTDRIEQLVRVEHGRLSYQSSAKELMSQFVA
ncbi:MAG: 1-acyl-sn-glycerol-3-phosphate acyltransferase [Oligoflexales bacterium]|nr:1-acyl-sn-glycerol-3-phosphate acyltransferase [Oligoflexales bacterium]